MYSKTIKISVVSPVYKAENIIDELVHRISEVVLKITTDFEIILVEDGSPDNSWKIIENQCNLNSQVKGIKLSRNFGQHYAITAGLQASRGEYVVVMDCDLQDNPVYIEEMYREICKGYDIIYTQKKSREHSFFKNFTAKLYFYIFNYLSQNVNGKYVVGAFSMISRKVVSAYCNIKDHHRHYLFILKWLGFSYSYIKIKHEKRYAGKSTYSLGKLIKHALDGITSQSDKLLLFSIFTGISMFFIAIIWGIVIITLYYIRGAQPGYTSIMAMLLFATGTIMMSIGITGIYIGKIFEQVKERPLYIVDKKLNF